MYKVTSIKGDTIKQYTTAVNAFFEQNKDIKLIDIQHLVSNFDDYTAIITYEEK